jgi:hypothetical protein
MHPGPVNSQQQALQGQLPPCHHVQCCVNCQVWHLVLVVRCLCLQYGLHNLLRKWSSANAVPAATVIAVAAATVIDVAAAVIAAAAVVMSVATSAVA